MTSALKTVGTHLYQANVTVEFLPRSSLETFCLIMPATEMEDYIVTFRQ
jgi:hypothetical protein